MVVDTGEAREEEVVVVVAYEQVCESWARGLSNVSSSGRIYAFDAFFLVWFLPHTHTHESFFCVLKWGTFDLPSPSDQQEYYILGQRHRGRIVVRSTAFPLASVSVLPL